MGDRRRRSDYSYDDEEEPPPSIMKKKERGKRAKTQLNEPTDYSRSAGDTTLQDRSRSLGRSGRMSEMSMRDSHVEARGFSSFARSGGSWETDWNLSGVSSRNPQRTGSRGLIQPFRSRSGSFRRESGLRQWNNMPTVQMEHQKSMHHDDTDPEELLRWETEARQRDVNRQMLLDQRKKLQMDDYNPDAHREHLVLISDREALAITANVLVGATFVGLPFAYVHSGLLVGSVGVFVMSVCVSYCMHILIYWRYEVMKELRQSWTGYPRTIEVAAHNGPNFISHFGVAFKVVLHILLIPYLIFSTAVQCVFMGQALEKIMDYLEQKKDIHAYIAILFVPLVPLSIIPNLKIMAIVSCFGICSSFVACILIIVAIIIVRRDHILTGELVQTNPDSPLYLLVTLSTLQPVAQLMCVESHMRNRKHYLGYFGVMNRALIMITCTYLLLSSIAYAKYAERTDDNILNNLALGKLEVASCSVFILSVMLTFPINVFTVYDFAWEVYLKNRLHGYPEIEKVLWGYAVRICVAILCVIIALIIVTLIELKYFIMSVCLPLLILVFPPIIELNMGYRKKEYGVRGHKFWVDIFLIVFGLATLILSLRAYILLYQAEH